MQSVRVYLRAPLFTTRTDAHLPAKAVVLDGELEDRSQGGLTLRVTAWLDHEARPLDGSTLRLFVPMAKVDHVLLPSEESAS
jgi:hypothetical protein